MALAKRSPPAEGSTKTVSLTGCGDSLQLFSHVLEFLSKSTWEDGTSRQTGTVMLLTESGRWKVWLHDRDAQEALWVSGETLDEALTTAEDTLQRGVGTGGVTNRGGG